MKNAILWRYYAVLDLIAELLGKIRIGSKTYVLMYHEVDNSFPTDCCHHTVQEFCDTIEQLESQNFAFISIDQLFDSNSISEKNNRCIITFDDVPESFYSNAYPILKTKNIPFTLFVSQQFLGKDGFLSESQLLKLAKDHLCTIGAHTISHCKLRNVSNPKDEMLNSKTHLEHLLGLEIKYLAYPYGKHSSVSYRTRRLARNCGFNAAFGTIDTPITGFTSLFRYYLPRMVVR